MDEHKAKTCAAFCKQHHMKTQEERDYASAAYDAVLNVPMVGDMLLAHTPQSAAKVMNTAICSTAQHEWQAERKPADRPPASVHVPLEPRETYNRRTDMGR